MKHFGTLGLSNRFALPPCGFVCASYWIGASSRQLHISLNVGEMPSKGIDATQADLGFAGWYAYTTFEELKRMSLKPGDVFATDLRNEVDPEFGTAV